MESVVEYERIVGDPDLEKDARRVAQMRAQLASRDDSGAKS